MNTVNHFENMDQVNYQVLQMCYYSLMTQFWKAHKEFKNKRKQANYNNSQREKIILIKGKWGKMESDRNYVFDILNISHQKKEEK